MENIKEEVLNMKREVEEAKREEKSLAYEMLLESKKQHKRDFIEKLVLIFILIISNIAWLLYMNQFDYISESTQIDSGNGNAMYIDDSNTGDVANGKN